MASPLKVLILAAEADPFVKVGGLGDVAGSLPAALRSLDVQIDARLAIPLHAGIQRRIQTQHPAMPLRLAAVFQVAGLEGPERAEAYVTEANGVPVYLIAGEVIPAEGPVYTSESARDAYKYTFFSLAALELCRALDWAPDIVHANDWHTAPAVYALGLNRKQGDFFRFTKTVIGVHNLPYLGLDGGPALASYGLLPADDSDLPEWARDLPLPLGLLSADWIVAASPSYAQEILTPEFGVGLHEFLNRRAGSITGILNGLDVERWNPATDSALSIPYTADRLELRVANKTALQFELDLQPDVHMPLLAMVTRLDPQKGVDLALAALRQLQRLPWQAVILGTGDAQLESAARRLEVEFPGRVRAIMRFDAALSHCIYGGADALLIPSRYEPCGLTQMIAMRYGCLPVARAVGGLRDTIVDGKKDKEGNGFLFQTASVRALSMTLQRTLHLYAQPDAWRCRQRHGMAQDFSWARSAGQYAELYEKLANPSQGTDQEKSV